MENRSPVLTSLLLEYLKLFCSIQGVPKVVQILTFFSSMFELSKLHILAPSVLQTLKKKRSRFGQVLGHPVINKIFFDTPKIQMITLGAYCPPCICLFGLSDPLYERLKWQIIKQICVLMTFDHIVVLYLYPRTQAPRLSENYSLLSLFRRSPIVIHL